MHATVYLKLSQRSISSFLMYTICYRDSLQESHMFIQSLQESHMFIQAYNLKVECIKYCTTNN